MNELKFKKVVVLFGEEELADDELPSVTTPTAMKNKWDREF